MKEQPDCGSEKAPFRLGRSPLPGAGFTLIELLVVIAIISLLSSIVLSSLQVARQKSRDSVRMAQIRAIATALELYANDHGGMYPPGAYDSRGASQWATFSGYLSPYMPTVPVDPLNAGGGGLMCGNCGEYFYQQRTTGASGFIISTYLETNIPSRTGSLDGTVPGCPIGTPDSATCNQYGNFFSIASNCTMASFWVCN